MSLTTSTSTPLTSSLTVATLRDDILDTISVSQCLVRAQPRNEALGWVQIWTSGATGMGALSFAVLILCFIGCCPKLANAIAPLHAKNHGRGCWGWVRAAFVEDEDNPMSIDGVVLVRFCILGRRFGMVGTLVGCVLVPLYAHNYEGNYDYQDFLRHTAASLSNGEHWHLSMLWIVVAAMYVLVIFFCWLVRREWHEFIALRRDHFVELARCNPDVWEDRMDGLCEAARMRMVHEAQSMHTVIVEHLPRTVQCADDVRSAFERVFPNGVVCVTVVEEDVRRLRRCCCCSKTEAPQMRPISAFVTFDSICKRTIALQSDAFFKTRHTKEHYEDWVILPAPQMDDLLWKNIANHFSRVRGRVLLFHIICVLGFVFWSSPMLALMTVTNPTFLHETFPETFQSFARYLALVASRHPCPSSFPYRDTCGRDSPFLHGVATAQLPMMAVWLVQAVLPRLFNYAAVYIEGRKQRSDIARTVFIRTFSYQAALSYFLAVGGTAALSVWTSYFRTTVKSPICILGILGQALPQVSVYYIAQVFNECTFFLPMSFVPWKRVLKALVGRGTDKPEYCNFAKAAIRLSLLLNFSNMFAVVCPLIMPACALYFTVAKCLFSWSLQNSYGKLVPGVRLREGEFDLQGELWYELFHAAMTGLLLGVFAMCGMILTRVAVALSDKVNDSPDIISLSTGLLFALLFLIAGIVWFWNKCWRTYYVWSTALTYEDSVEIDGDANRPEVVANFDPLYYTSPVKSAVMPGGVDGAKSRNLDEAEAGSSDEAESQAPSFGELHSEALSVAV